MKLQPKKTKYKKYQKGKIINRIISKNNFIFPAKGTIILKAMFGCKLTGKQIEVLYNTLNKFLKRNGSIYINIFPNIAISRKPTEFRMGKGKGAVDHWVCKILPGTTLCEIETNNFKKVQKAITYAKFRMPIRIKTIIL